MSYKEENHKNWLSESFKIIAILFLLASVIASLGLGFMDEGYYGISYFEFDLYNFNPAIFFSLLIGGFCGFLFFLTMAKIVIALNVYLED